MPRWLTTSATLAAVLFALLQAGPSLAADSEAPSRPDRRAARETGQVLTVLGSVPLALGTTGLLFSWRLASRPCAPLDPCEGPGAAVPYSAIVAGAGASLVIPGVALWIHGRKRDTNLRISLAVTPGYRGVQLAWRPVRAR